MMQVSSRKIFASVTVTTFINWLQIITVLSIFNFDIAISCKKPTISCITSRHYTIKHINSFINCINQIFRCSNPHKISWFIFWHFWGNKIYYPMHFIFRFPNGQTSYCITIKINVRKCF